MADYTFSPSPVLVETTGEFAIGATGVLRPTEGGDPVTVYDLNDSPLPAILVGPKGAHQAFKADIAAGILDFGSVLLPSESVELRAAGLSAVTLAQAAVADAAAALEIAQDALTQIAGATASDTAVAALVSGDTVTADELRAHYLPMWLPSETVTAGTIRVAPTGETINRDADGVTREAYDATESALWTVVSGGASFEELPAGAVMAVVQNGDGTWPARHTSRVDVLGLWVRVVAGSDDPADAVSPSLAGMYDTDLVVGA